ncbi:MAG: glycosyltransferase family 4 protein [Candidatus Uhrbacteria bacterium]
MRRVLLLTLDFPPRFGGVARYLWGLAEYWREQVSVLAPHEEGEETADKIASFPVERIDLYFKWFWPRWLKAFFLLVKRSRNFDTLWISHVLPLGTVALLAKLFLGKRYLVFMHSMDFALATRNGWKKMLTRTILKGAEVVVTNSRALSDRVQTFIPNLETLVIYPSVNPDFTRAAVACKQTASARPTLLTVGRLVGRKGHHKVLDAMDRLFRGNHVANLRYLIVGTGMEYSSILKHVQKLKLEPYVDFFQNVSHEELPNFYQAADIFVMPTENKSEDREGFGIVYHEAGLSCLPVIGSKLPGVDEAVIHGETGILVEAGNIDQLAAAIKYLVENEPARRQLGEAGNKRILAEFTVEAQAEKLRPFMI